MWLWNGPDAHVGSVTREVSEVTWDNSLNFSVPHPTLHSVHANDGELTWESTLGSVGNGIKLEQDSLVNGALEQVLGQSFCVLFYHTKTFWEAVSFHL